MDFVVAPAPMPQDQLDAGRKPVAWSGGFSLVIPATARQKEGAFKFIQYLRSWEAVQLLERGSQEQREAEGRIYLPRVRSTGVLRATVERTCAEQPTHARDVQASVPADPRAAAAHADPPGHAGGAVAVDPARPRVRRRRAARLRRRGASSDDDEVELALERNQAIVQAELDAILTPPPPTVVKWTPYLWLYASDRAHAVRADVDAYRRRRREYGYRAREVGAAMLFASPWMIGFIVLVGGPILFSIVFSFTRYDVLNDARYVGASNFTEVFTDPTFYRSLLNTLFMVLRIPLGMVVSLAIALLLNRAVRRHRFLPRRLLHARDHAAGRREPAVDLALQPELRPDQ